jgi:hypothetical protein
LIGRFTGIPVLVTGGERLRRASENVGLRAMDPDKQEHDIRDLFG